MRGYPKFQLLSCPLQLMSKEELLDIVTGPRDTKGIVLANQNLHGMALLQRSDDLRSFYRNSHFCYIDGMPLVWLAKLCGFPAESSHRTTHLDWFPELLQRLASEGRSLFFLGSPPKVTEKIVNYLRESYPGLKLHAHHGYFEPEESERIAAMVHEANPDLLILGMGMPQQELWLQRYLDRLAFGVAIPSGAIFEYFVGEQKAPSRASGRLGMEWLVRLWSNPQRLAGRYLVEPWSLVWPALMDIWHYRLGSGREKRLMYLQQIAER